MFAFLMPLVLLLSSTVFFSACQKKPALGGAADPMSLSDPPPMGSSTYNDELKIELNILDDILEKRIDERQLARIKNDLWDGKERLVNEHKLGTLAKVLLTLPELFGQIMPRSENHKLFLRGKYYFLKRRFIEAATLFTEVLKVDPSMDEARNLRARAIFFLGNPDQAVLELKIIVDKNGESSPHGIDALYLIGAIIYESNDTDKKRIAVGLDAWSRYLKHADIDHVFKKELTESIAQLKSRGNERPMPHFVDPFAPNIAYSEKKNAILTAFLKEELMLAMGLAEDFLKQSYDPDIATILARILFKTGRLDEAKKHYESIVDKDENYAPAHVYRGMAFMLQGEPEKAILSWKTALQKNPSYARLHNLEQRIARAQEMIEPNKIKTH